MIDFFIHINDISISEKIDISCGRALSFEESGGNQRNEIVLFKTTKHYKVVINDKVYLFIGDVIPPIGYKNDIVQYCQSIAQNFIPEKIRDLSGFFYLITLSTQNNEISVYNSLFSILPLFYYKQSNRLIIASNTAFIKNSTDTKLTVDKKYILEKLLFNYGFLNNTIYKEIKLVPSNSFMHIGQNKLSFTKHTDIRDFFVNNHISSKKTIQYLADLFIDQTIKYFPSEKSSIAFTGGFDGRTIISVAKNASIDFSAYSFGAKNNDDVSIPLAQSELLGIDFKPFFLEDKKYTDDFLQVGKELIGLSSGMSSFLYTHFLYSTKELSEDTGVLLTGYFGSELNRSLNVAGAVTSRKLIDLFLLNDQAWSERIFVTPRLNFLNRGLYKNELQELVDDVLEYKKELNYDMTLNQKFYVYIFEETFRKMFGSIIVAQMKYQKVRTPFLDFKYITELLKTSFAGVNNSFFTNNPIKRFKGQRLYAEIIKKTSPEVLKLKTGKGYAPNDLISFKGKYNILAPFFSKRIKRVISKPNLDNLLLLSNIFNNRQYFINNLNQTELYNNDLIKYKLSEFNGLINEVERDMIITSITLNEIY
ncbi:MAG: hypothetical protein DRJ10_12980 [Bacteroidetes bacterium]|nr:MAG: hypothetical protein DRJ10_12980 [Bacteroidota bacterium]